MIVGHDITIRRNHESGALALRRTLLSAAFTLTEILGQVLEEVMQRVIFGKIGDRHAATAITLAFPWTIPWAIPWATARRIVGNLGCAAIIDHGNRDNRRLNLIDEIGERHGRLAIRRVDCGAGFRLGARRR